MRNSAVVLDVEKNEVIKLTDGIDEASRYAFELDKPVMVCWLVPHRYVENEGKKPKGGKSSKSAKSTKESK